MSKCAKIWLIVAAALVTVGVILFGGMMSVLRWDFLKLSTVDYVTNEHVLDEDYHDIEILTDTADVIFVPSKDGTTSILCYEPQNETHTVSVRDGVLTVELVDTRKWYEHIGIGFHSSKITLALPAGEYGDLTLKASTGATVISEDFVFERMDITKSTGAVTCRASAMGEMKIQASTGDIRTEGISADSLTLSVTTGRVTVEDATVASTVDIRVQTGKTQVYSTTCDSLYSDGSTGSLLLQDVAATGEFSLRRSTGDITLERCDASALSISTSTGNVTGTLLSEKVFLAHSDTGRVEVPSSVTGGRCEVTASTGDIRLSVQN